MDREHIRQFLNSGAGIGLKQYLVLKLNELKDIDNLQEKDVGSHQIIEIKSQKRAYKKLKEILGEIVDLSEVTNKKDPRDDFTIGLD